MAQKSPIVTIFGSSRLRPDDSEYRTAYELGSLLAGDGYTVCNGGYGGSMEASAKGARENGGRTIGILAEMFGSKPNLFIDRAIVMKTHVERLLKLAELGEAYVVLKGSTGTLLELAYVWECLNKGIISKKQIIVLGDFWQPVIATLGKELAWEGAGAAAHHLTVARSPKECLVELKKYFASR